MQQLAVRVSDEVLAKLREGRADGQTIQWQVNKALELYLSAKAKLDKADK